MSGDDDDDGMEKGVGVVGGGRWSRCNKKCLICNCSLDHKPTTSILDRGGGGGDDGGDQLSAEFREALRFFWKILRRGRDDLEEELRGWQEEESSFSQLFHPTMMTPQPPPCCSECRGALLSILELQRVIDESVVSQKAHVSWLKGALLETSSSAGGGGGGSVELSNSDDDDLFWGRVRRQLISCVSVAAANESHQFLESAINSGGGGGGTAAADYEGYNDNDFHQDEDEDYDYPLNDPLETSDLEQDKRNKHHQSEKKRHPKRRSPSKKKRKVGKTTSITNKTRAKRAKKEVEEEDPQEESFKGRPCSVALERIDLSKIGDLHGVKINPASIPPPPKKNKGPESHDQKEGDLRRKPRTTKAYHVVRKGSGLGAFFPVPNILRKSKVQAFVDPDGGGGDSSTMEKDCETETTASASSSASSVGHSVMNNPRTSVEIIASHQFVKENNNSQMTPLRKTRTASAAPPPNEPVKKNTSKTMAVLLRSVQNPTKVDKLELVHTATPSPPSQSKLWSFGNDHFLYHFTPVRFCSNSFRCLEYNGACTFTSVGSDQPAFLRMAAHIANFHEKGDVKYKSSRRKCPLCKMMLNGGMNFKKHVQSAHQADAIAEGSRPDWDRKMDTILQRQRNNNDNYGLGKGKRNNNNKPLLVNPSPRGEASAAGGGGGPTSSTPPSSSTTSSAFLHQRRKRKRTVMTRRGKLKETTLKNLKAPFRKRPRCDAFYLLDGGTDDKKFLLFQNTPIRILPNGLRCLEGGNSSCSMEVVGKDYDSLQTIKYHIMDDHDDREYCFIPRDCPLCQTTFQDGVYLRNHLLNVHPQQLKLLCDSCWKPFPEQQGIITLNKRELTDHMWTHKSKADRAAARAAEKLRRSLGGRVYNRRMQKERKRRLAKAKEGEWEQPHQQKEEEEEEGKEIKRETDFADLSLPHDEVDHHPASCSDSDDSTSSSSGPPKPKIRKKKAVIKPVVKPNPQRRRRYTRHPLFHSSLGNSLRAEVRKRPRFEWFLLLGRQFLHFQHTVIRLLTNGFECMEPGCWRRIHGMDSNAFTELRYHIIDDHDGRDYSTISRRCPLCQQVLQDGVHLRNHLYCVHPHPRQLQLLCDICWRTFSGIGAAQKRELAQHRATHFGEVDKAELAEAESQRKLLGGKKYNQLLQQRRRQGGEGITWETNPFGIVGVSPIRCLEETNNPEEGSSVAVANHEGGDDDDDDAIGDVDDLEEPSSELISQARGMRRSKLRAVNVMKSFSDDDDNNEEPATTKWSANEKDDEDFRLSEEEDNISEGVVEDDEDGADLQPVVATHSHSHPSGDDEGVVRRKAKKEAKGSNPFCQNSLNASTRRRPRSDAFFLLGKEHLLYKNTSIRIVSPQGPLLVCLEEGCSVEVRCDTDYDAFQEMRYHVLDDHDEEDYPTKPRSCVLCNEQFPDGVNLKNHLFLRHQAQVRYVCECCWKPFPDKDSSCLTTNLAKLLSDHMMTHKSGPEREAHLLAEKQKKAEGAQNYNKRMQRLRRQAKISKEEQPPAEPSSQVEVVVTVSSESQKNKEEEGIIVKKGKQVLDPSSLYSKTFMRVTVELLIYKFTLVRFSGGKLTCGEADCSGKSTEGCSESDFQDMKRHISNRHESREEYKNEKRTCPVCSEECESGGWLRRHIFRSHARAECICEICLKPVLTSGRREDRFRAHLWSHKNQLELASAISSERKGNVEPLLKLMEADKSGQEFPSSEEDHHAHICDECGKVLVSVYGLASHKETHLPRSARQQYVCEECGISLLSVVALRSHISREHKPELQKKHWICPICSRKYHSRDGESYRIHVRSHRNERPFICEQCGEGFTSRERLKRHFISHTEVKTFQCEYCEMSYKYRGGLRRHQEAAHKEHHQVPAANKKEVLVEQPVGFGPKIAFPCHHCDKVFPLRSRMTKHVRKSHSGAVVDVDVDNDDDDGDDDP